MSKRKRPDPKAAPIPPSQILDGQVKTIYELIKSRGEKGIWIKDIRLATNIQQDTVVKKCLMMLIGRKQVKEVADFQNKGKKTYMAVEFKPSNELTGGYFYEKGKLDKDRIEDLNRLCMEAVSKMGGVGRKEDITNEVNRRGGQEYEIPSAEIEKLVDNLWLSDELIRTKSTGEGEFIIIPKGDVCYKLPRKNMVPNTSAFASIPCGVCPHMSICTPDGLVSPSNCVYFDKWLEF
ncbi:hypothetical protein QQ045_004486 [Rhodiola kirilowii]